MRLGRYMRYAVRYDNGAGPFRTEWFDTFIIRREGSGHMFYYTGHEHGKLFLKKEGTFPGVHTRILLATPLSHRLWFAAGVTKT